MDGTSTKKAEAPVKGKGKKTKAPAPKKEKAPAESLVVFAIRVPESERTALHEMAGSGKSTKLVRALIGAAIAADVEGFKRLITTTK